MRKLGGILTTAVLAMTLAAAAVAPTDAAPVRRAAATRAFDGIWSVSIFTRTGPCGPSYRYAARIYGGRVLPAENSYDYQISGVVVSSGAIAVTVTSGGQSATGYGRMTPTRGGGSWRTQYGDCTGVWTAARR